MVKEIFSDSRNFRGSDPANMLVEVAFCVLFQEQLYIQVAANDNLSYKFHKKVILKSMNIDHILHFDQYLSILDNIDIDSID